MPLPPLIQRTPKGLYCAAGDFFIDPWAPVNKAIITHAHSDHARTGSQQYLCHHHSVPLLQLRLGNHAYKGIAWNQPVHINGVSVSLHPAGHIIGSSQVRIAYKGEVWVVSGDYKLENDGLSGAFEPVTCHTFVTESTFGLPIYTWQPQAAVYAQMQQWVLNNQANGITSVLIAYSLGKAQRVVQALHPVAKQIFVHGAIANTHDALLRAGFQLPQVHTISAQTPVSALKGTVVIAPPSTLDTTWMQRFSPYATGICSGWMQVRGNVKRSNADAAFVLSDHADWPGLLQAIKATQAQKVWVTHGFQSVLSRYLNEQGIEADEITTQFGAEEV